MSQDLLINASRSPCYMIGDRTLHIYGDFNQTNMTELIGRLSYNIHNTIPVAPVYDISTKIDSPYNIDNSQHPIIDIFIDSNGGDTRMLQNLTTLLNIAKMRGAIVRTTVLSRAYSCGSMLAIQGTPGFRIMPEYGTHMIHFGSSSVSGSSETELEKRLKNSKLLKAYNQKLYSTYTKMTEQEIEQLCSTEGDYLDAKRCKRLGLCDWIVDLNSKLIIDTKKHSK